MRIRALTAAVPATALLLLGLSVPAHSDDAPPALDLVTHNAVLIDAPAAAVWPYILDPGDWKAGAALVSTGGPGGAARERYKAVMPDDPDTVLFYVDNVEIDPQRRRTMRLTSPANVLMGFASFELTGHDGATLVEYHVYSHSPLPPEVAAGMTAAQLAEQQQAYTKNNYERFAAELLALKALVENAPPE